MIETLATVLLFAAMGAFAFCSVLLNEGRHAARHRDRTRPAQERSRPASSPSRPGRRGHRPTRRSRTLPLPW